MLRAQKCEYHRAKRKQPFSFMIVTSVHGDGHRKKYSLETVSSV